MYKHSLSRNQRSKGFKVKQVLQICVLVAVCFWLIYQVKHSHDKKKAFEENNANASLETNSHIGKFGGRKDIQDPLQKKPFRTEKKDEEETEEENGVEEEDSKHEENVEEDDSKHEENVEEDDSKHEENEDDDDSQHVENGEEDNYKHEEEEQEEENHNEEKDDDKRGGGDDEIDEHEQEKSEMEIEHEVDVLDEERDKEEVNENEENENEDKDAQNEEASHVEDHDHEAREEHYKGDDASSAVTHESESVTAESGRGTLENPAEKMETVVPEDGNVTVNNEKITVEQNSTSVSEKGEFAVKKEEEYEIVASRQVENTISNSTTTMEANNQEEKGNDLAKKSVETNDTFIVNSTEAKQGAGEGEISTNTSSNNTHSNSSSVNSQDIVTSLGESLNSSTTLQNDVSGKQNEEIPEENSNENLESEKEMGENENGEGYLSHHDPIDESDSSILLEKDVRTDLETLPDIRTEGSNDEEAAAE